MSARPEVSKPRPDPSRTTTEADVQGEAKATLSPQFSGFKFGISAYLPHAAMPSIEMLRYAAVNVIRKLL